MRLLLKTLLLLGFLAYSTLPSLAQTQPVPYVGGPAKNGQTPVDTTDGISRVTVLYELPNYVARLVRPEAERKGRPSSTGIFSFLDQEFMGRTLDEFFEISLKHIKRPEFENPEDFEMIRAVMYEDLSRIDEAIIKFWFIKKKLLKPRQYSRN